MLPILVRFRLASYEVIKSGAIPIFKAKRNSNLLNGFIAGRDISGVYISDLKEKHLSTILFLKMKIRKFQLLNAFVRMFLS